VRRPETLLSFVTGPPSREAGVFAPGASLSLRIAAVAQSPSAWAGLVSATSAKPMPAAIVFIDICSER
jgi:hypothetical protein